jgi:hypothetical protein
MKITKKTKQKKGGINMMIKKKEVIVIFGQRNFKKIICVLMVILTLLNATYANLTNDFIKVLQRANFTDEMNLPILFVVQVLAIFIIFIIGYIIYKISVAIINVRLNINRTIKLQKELQYSKEWIFLIYFIVAIMMSLVNIFSVTIVALDQNIILGTNLILHIALYAFIYSNNKVVFNTLLVLCQENGEIKPRNSIN